MVLQQSYELDSMGVLPRRGETEKQYHSRADIVVNNYNDLTERLVSGDTEDIEFEIPRLFGKLDFHKDRETYKISKAPKIEETIFERPIMPVIDLKEEEYEKTFPANSGGTIIRYINDDRKNIYAIPLINDDFFNKLPVFRDERHEHETQHTIDGLKEDPKLMETYFHKMQAWELIPRIFFDYRNVKVAPHILNSEMIAYFTDDSGIKNDISGNFETNADAISHFVSKNYIDRAKKSALISASLGSLFFGRHIMDPDNSIDDKLLAAFQGARAIGKTIEYLIFTSKKDEFVDTVEYLENFSEQEEMSLLPMMGRISFKEVKRALNGIKRNGVEDFFDKKMQNKRDGYRWDIINDRVMSTKGKRRPEL